MEVVKVEVMAIKETLELMDALELVAIAGKKAFADGKVSFTDVAVLMELAKQYGILMAAVDGVAMVVPELKDISSEELAAIGARALMLAKKFKEA